MTPHNRQPIVTVELSFFRIFLIQDFSPHGRPYTNCVQHCEAHSNQAVTQKPKSKRNGPDCRALQKFPYVSRVQINLNAGTIIVHHDEEALEDIESKLKDLGIILMAAVGVEISSMSLTDAVSDLARHLGLGTKGIPNLKLMVPLGLGALAVFQLARQGLQIGSAPWYLIAYFAFDSYIKLNSPEEKCSPVGSTAGE